jgi:TolB-like protein/class 3 adenylate cyclase
VSEDATGSERRRLAAILFAGYKRLQPADEANTFTGLTLLRTEILEPQILKFGGRIIRWTGDEVFLEFPSVVAAVRCAAVLIDAASRLNEAVLPDRRIGLSIGINLDDIIIEDGDLFGDGVNIAARLEALAEPGSIYISGAVYDRIVDKVDFDFIDLGPQSLKNISRPIRVYRTNAYIGTKPAAAIATGSEPAATARIDDRRAIAVLPFANFSDDPEQEFFADGITEDIITMLAGWRAFPVIARGSTFNYKGQTVDIKKVGEELGVRYVVEGSVRKSGRRVRVNAQLIRTDNSHHIMAERYDRDLTDLFELQDEIVHTIAGAIQPELLKFERERIAEQPQHDEDAYEFYQRGMFHHYRHSKTDNAKAQTYFRHALAIDVQYPQATAALAISVCNAAYVGWAEDIEGSYVECDKLAKRAVGLDARYPNAHFALGLVCMWTRRSDRAIVAFQETIKLNPSFAPAHVLLGQMYLYSGRPEKAMELAEKGIRLSPSDPRMFLWLPALAGAHYQLGHYDRAVEIGRRGWALNRNYPACLRYVVAGLGQLGRIEEAQGPLADLRILNTNLAFVEGNLTRLYANREGVDHFLEGLRKAGLE